MNFDDQASALEEAVNNNRFIRAQQTKAIYLAFVTSIMLATIIQATLTLFYDPDLHTFSASNVEKTNMITHILQITGSFCMAILYFILLRLSLKSSRHIQKYRIFRYLLQLAYNIYSLEATIIPLHNSNNSVAAQVLFLEVILLDIAFLLYESNSFVGGFVVIAAYVVYMCQISYNQLVLLIPYLLVNVVGLVFFHKSCNIEKALRMTTLLKCRNGEIYQSFLNLLPEGVAILMDGPKLRYANSSIQRILGCTEEDSIVKCLLDLKNVDVYTTAREEIRFPLDFGKVASNDSPPYKHRKDSFEGKSFLLKRSNTPDESGVVSSNRNPSAIDISYSSKLHSSNWNDSSQKINLSEKPKAQYKPSKFDASQKSQSGSSQKVSEKEKPSSDIDRPSEKSFLTINQNKNQYLNINIPHVGKNRNTYLLNLAEKTDTARQENNNKVSESLSSAAIKGSFLLHSKMERGEGSELEPSQLGSINGSFLPLPQGSPWLGASRKPSGNNLSSNLSQNKVTSFQMMTPNSASVESITEAGLKTPSRFRIPEYVSFPKSIDLSDKKFQDALNNQDSPTLKEEKEREKEREREREREKEKDNAGHNVLMKYAGKNNNNHNKRFLPSKTLEFPQSNQVEEANMTTKQFLRQRTEYDSTNVGELTQKFSNKLKELKSFTSKHNDIKSAYESLIKKLHDEREEDLHTQSSTTKIDKPSWFSSLRKWFHKQSSLSQMTTSNSHKKKKKMKFKVDENDYCIIINSKIKGVKERFLEIKLSPTFIDNVPCILALVKDTTDRDMLNRMKETDNYKNTLLASVSHELRTPLNCVISMQEELRDFIDPELVTRYLNPAINSSKLLLTLVNDILDFAQIRAGKLRETYEDFDLRELLTEALNLFEIPRKSRGIEMKLEWDSKIPRNFYSDKNKINQVVVNLLGNALKFTLKGSIRLRAFYEGPRRVCIMVSDTGSGIKKSDIPKIFSAFGKIENNPLNPKGVGLGLSISQTIAKRLGPRGNKGISVESKVGIGSHFYFIIESKEKSVMEDQADMEEENPLQEEEDKLANEEEAKAKVNLNQNEGELNFSDEVFDDGELSDRHHFKPEQNIQGFNKMAEMFQAQKCRTLLGVDSRGSGGTMPVRYSYPSARAEIFENHSGNVREYKISSQLKIPFDELKPINFSLNVGPSPKASDLLSIEMNQKSFASGNSPAAGNNSSKNNLNEPKSFEHAIVQSQALSDGSNAAALKSPKKTAEFTSFTNRITEDNKKDPPAQQKQAQYITATTHLNVAINLDPKTRGTVSTTTTSKLATMTTLASRICNCEDVLIVDDNDFNILALKQMLESLGHKVATALNGEIAIRVVVDKKNSSCCKAFKIVFMDCDMPVKNGYETTKELRMMQKAGLIAHFPIVATTAYVNEREVNYCFECGMNDYMNKPMRKDKLKDIIKKWYKK